MLQDKGQLFITENGVYFYAQRNHQSPVLVEESTVYNPTNTNKLTIPFIEITALEKQNSLFASSRTIDIKTKRKAKVQINVNIKKVLT